ncbi:hypothetical protein F5144DRAFT_534042 [Chaetomium tenue]|uniref:Uncharacterized protein n=1 Tax=Chaetomium tenue TaxID=1854479 RepID=A0ACB7P922_9PEZI|nr:hypothetical protein F5144DRAFT_534042 [Chaetomium globosum]
MENYPLFLHCVFCGWFIGEKHGSVSWKNEFRGCNRHIEEDVHVTGVGLYSDPVSGRFIAPQNVDARWCDPGYANLDEDQFGVFAWGEWLEFNGKRGFVFHDACWSLVKQAYHPTPVPCERLFEVLDSLTMTDSICPTLDWGHDYGGLQGFLEGKIYDWETQVAYMNYETEYNGIEHVLQEPAYYNVNPLANSEVEAILTETPQAPPSRDPLLPTESSSPGRDPFASLPVELRSAIATYLSTPDALNTRRASPSFWFIFDSQQFWASRFKGTVSERSWLFEAVSGSTARGVVGHRDWRGLYKRTADARLAEGTRNRKRIWDLIIQHMVDVLALSWNELPDEVPLPWHIPPLPEDGSPKQSGIKVAGCLPLHTRYDGLCTGSKVQRVAIPTNDISRIGVSTVGFGGNGYICGLSLTATNGEVIRLGYNVAGNEHSLQLDGAALTGFNLAVGMGGIQALQCVSTSNARKHLSAWIGFTDGIPMTERLGRVTTSGETMVLKLEFGGFRMVSLAAFRDPKHPIPKGLRVDDDVRNLRNSAIWFPHPPPSSLNLNEGFMIAPDMYMSGYRPLFWTWFGGPGGSFLTSLVKITFTHLQRIDFIFNNPQVPTGCRSFGQDNRVGKSKHGVQTILIDGPGGENIHTIELYHVDIKCSWARSPGFREGSLVWLKIHTNRGRMWEVGTEPYPHRTDKMKRVFSAAPGDAITGFYGYQVFTLPLHSPPNCANQRLTCGWYLIQLDNGIISIGIITEPILPS